MLYWVLFTPAVLATARRTGTALSVVPSANTSRDTRDILSVQEISAVVRDVDSTEVCVEVQTSRSYSSTGGQQGHKLDRGDHACAKKTDQDSSAWHALSTLATDNLVRLRWSTVRVTKIVDRGGRPTKESILEHPVVVLKVGAEISRQVKAIQRLRTEYAGSIKPEGAQMVVPTGVNDTTDFSCFTIKSSMNYMSVPPSETAKGLGKLDSRQPFCIHHNDEGSTTTATVRTLAVGEVVTVLVVSEMVEYRWNDGAGKVDIETEWEFKFDLKKGTQANDEILREEATVMFESAKAVSGSGEDNAMRWCFKTMKTQTENERDVCFLTNLQSVVSQVGLTSLVKDKSVHLGWRKCKVSFINANGHTVTTAGEQNLLLSIGM